VDNGGRSGSGFVEDGSLGSEERKESRSGSERKVEESRSGFKREVDCCIGQKR